MDEIINTEVLGEKIVEVLKTIYDPEIPVDIYELGLIYDVFVNEDRTQLPRCRISPYGSERKGAKYRRSTRNTCRNYFRSPLESRYDERGGETRIRIFVN